MNYAPTKRAETAEPCDVGRPKTFHGSLAGESFFESGRFSAV